MNAWLRPPLARRAPRLSGLALLLLLHALPAHAWVQSRGDDGAPVTLDRRCFGFYLNEMGSEDLPLDQLEEAVVASYQTWADVDCSAQTFLYQGRTPARQVGFVERIEDNLNLLLFHERFATPEDEDGWIHERGVIAVTTITSCQSKGGICPFIGAIIDADIEMNGAEFTFTDSDNILKTLYDVRNTVTHEVGHILGLDHPPGPSSATMYATAPEGEILKRTLHADDIEGLCTLYPLPDGAVGECEPVGWPEARGDEGWGWCAFGPRAQPQGGLMLLILLALLAAPLRRGRR